MDPNESRQFSESDYYDFWENEDRRNDFEEPWYWTIDEVSSDLGDYEESGDDIEGVNAWLRLVTNANSIHHGCSTGAATGRCVHSHPNLAQVPSDERFRRLFLPTPGQVMVGADLSGVELRMLLTISPVTITADTQTSSLMEISIKPMQIR